MTFFKHHEPEQPRVGAPADFGYLDPDAHYFDSACQTLRPQPVISAVQDYYQNYNACGGRAKYAWGEKIDGIVSDVRTRLLKLLDKSRKDYTVAFCLNTTAGINMLLQQLPEGRYQRIVTSDIEHNSVFLPSQVCAKRFGLERLVLPRLSDGSLDFRQEQLERAVVVVNTTSNIDGRMLENLDALVTAAHRSGGAVILDAAQTMGHEWDVLRGVNPDAICGSAHKMYGPSLGFIVVRRAFLSDLNCFLLGGGTVSDVRRDDFDLLDAPDEAFARLEPGLQDFAGIAGLGAALEWMTKYRPEGRDADSQQSELARILFDSISSNQRLKIVNRAAAPVISFHSTHVDSHRLALYLSAQNIMVRSGYFCCHYYLQRVAQLPPLVRISIGLHNTAAEATHVADVIHKIVSQI